LRHVAAIPLLVDIGLVLALPGLALPMLGIGGLTLGAVTLGLAIALMAVGVSARLWPRMFVGPGEVKCR
jgi:TRAP-type mannitol/chloroaromatic compound transport system permease large subunit